ncbi:hypothetical protein NHQ30_007461 [Ciborinia camelliae]|nr:hypothetical protein NHQ30_007461 [Ciborinia camelliae]
MLVMAPFWSGFHFQFRNQPKVKIVPIHAPDEALFNEGIVHYLQQALTKSQEWIKGVIICNPHNPLGQCYTRKALCEIAKFCENNDLHLLSDEIYSLSKHETREDNDVVPFTSMLDLDLKKLGVSLTRLHVIWGVSKDFCCNGLRLGVFISRNKDAVIGVAATSNTQVSCLTSLSAKKLLVNKAYLSKVMSLNRTRLATAYATISAVFRDHDIQYYPASSGIFVWGKLSKRVKTWDEEAQLAKAIETQRIIVSQGKSYASFKPGWYRLSFAIPQRELKKALIRLIVGIESN